MLNIKLMEIKGRQHIVFYVGYLVWLHLHKDRFLDLRKSKLMPRAAGPFKVLEKINDNAYKLELPADYGVSPAFNIADLKPYFGEEDEIVSRTTSIQEGEDDEDIPPIVTTTSPTTIQGAITRARARQLNYQVLSFLGTIPIIHENMILPKTDMFVTLRNNGPSQEEKDKHWSMMIHGDGSMHARIGHDATSGDLDEISREHTSYFRP